MVETSASAATLTAALDPFTHRDWVDDDKRSFWQVLDDTIKEKASSYPQPGQESEEEEGSTMAALMKNTDEEKEINCKLVRDVT